MTSGQCDGALVAKKTVPAVQLRSLSKQFSDHLGVDSDLTVPPGIVGANRTAKTTVLSTLKSDLLDGQTAELGWSLRTSAADMVTAALVVVLGVTPAWSAFDAVRIVQRLRRGRANQPQGMRS